MSFSDKVILVTGAGSGIGKGIAIHFARLSAKLSLIDSNSENLNSVAQECENISKMKVFKVFTDITVRDDIKNAVNDTVRHFGTINVLMNCAEIGSRVGIFSPNLMTIMEKIIAVNLKAAIAFTHYAADSLIENKGNVINIASLFASTVIKEALPYSVSKAGLVHFTRCAALELADKGVRVNCISPGPVRSNMVLGEFETKQENDENWDTWAKDAPLKHLVTEDEVAELAEFLASNKARSVTGTDYIIDCGWSVQKC
ncbi:uncharacterized oxidoreductase TM_0325-like [Danaus plexippus]|uniref:uncharacterized oxidoreductase TM_0325-like n=2 Tax=Danaus plexippus TaxID=13037 RepID=UPI0013C4C776|nr:uncharacterized oxidoreductase TM_0325-like [Danaus plexippus]XP_032524654.1 uncharacterized oxidoreductase TM_0325-like [Danaus plexippus plexippus]